MDNIGKVLLKMGLLSLLSVMPLAAQIDNGVDFTASFPFYAGDVKLPGRRLQSRTTGRQFRYIADPEQRRFALDIRRFHTNGVCATSPRFCCHFRKIWEYGLSRSSLD